MFCKIRKGKTSYSIYICERYRKNGKVMSNDRKIVTYGYHSLYEGFEDYNINFNKLPKALGRSLMARILNHYTIELYNEVESKLLKLKKEYYPEYKELCKKLNLEYSKQKEQREEDYNKFKKKYKDLFYQELSSKYQEGYLSGQLASFNFSSGKNLDIDNQEKKLLKKIYKKMAMEFHPDRNSDNQDEAQEIMVMINKLKEQWRI